MAAAADDPQPDDSRTHPRTRPPDRTGRVDVSGISIATYEWGPEDAPPLVLSHGGFDFARTFDVFAPLLAEGGWRVVSWDQRGHGDSDRAPLYQWDADTRDLVAVLDSVSQGPVPMVGHSKGGSLTTHLTAALPHRVSAVVNIDGIPSRRPMPDVQDRDRTKMLASDLAAWLDRRHEMGDAARRPGTITDLAARRGRMNPRLSTEWLEYLVTIGATRSDDGWRWKIDPTMRMGGFGPWRPEWSMQRIADISVPFLALLATEAEAMGFGTRAADLAGFMPPRGRVIEVPDAGHFVHIEHPDLVADLVLEHLAVVGP